uniref:Riboflavin transporter n=1 Tax=Corethrella appendiculata TaxID=1370023 RepID=U5EMU0_9DIPT
MKRNLSKYHQAIKNRKLFTDLCAIFFGIGSWIGVNSIFLQLPLLVSSTPEGWNLPSFLVVIIQIANIGPILYTGLQKIKAFRDAHMIYCVLIIGSIAAFLMIFFYKNTMYVFGSDRSLILFVIVFFLALVGCTSSVLFMPYMGRFRDIYLITYLIGEGLSGFLPSIVALFQGVGGNAQCIPNNSTNPNAPKYIRFTPPPRFETQSFFVFIFFMYILSSISFAFLNLHKVCRNEHAVVTIKNGNNYKYDNTVQTDVGDLNDNEGKTKDNDVKIISAKNYVVLIVILGIMCMFGNGFFPSIQSYSCLPYGNIAYHLTATLSSIANPIACFMAVFLPHTSIRSIISLSILSMVIACYAIATSVMSPTPPFIGTIGGEILIVVTWTLLMGLIGYIRLSITAIYRYQGGKSLVWIGAMTQIGSFIGSVVSFSLVNFTNIFTSYQPC